MNIDIKIDEQLVKRELKKIVETQTIKQIKDFSEDKLIYSDGKCQNVKSQLNCYIKSKIDEEFDKFKSSDYISQYVEKNWKRILDQSLEKALTHKANAIAFNSDSIKNINSKS